MKRKQDIKPTLPTTDTAAPERTTSETRSLPELSESDLAVVNAGVKWYEWSVWD